MWLLLIIITTTIFIILLFSYKTQGFNYMALFQSGVRAELV